MKDKSLTEQIPTEWNDLVDKLDELFPKGECKERGEAMVLLAFFKLYNDSAITRTVEECIDALKKSAPSINNDFKETDPDQYTYDCGLRHGYIKAKSDLERKK